MKTTLWRKINTYNNTKRTNHQKRKSARIWTHRKNTLRALTELTKHYPIFRNNIRSLYRSIQIRIRRITSKLCNQLSRTFYTTIKNIPKTAEKNYSFDIHLNQIYSTRKSSLTPSMNPGKTQ